MKSLKRLVRLGFSVTKLIKVVLSNAYDSMSLLFIMYIYILFYFIGSCISLGKVVSWTLGPPCLRENAMVLATSVFVADGNCKMAVRVTTKRIHAINMLGRSSDVLHALNQLYYVYIYSIQYIVHIYIYVCIFPLVCSVYIYIYLGSFRCLTSNLGVHIRVSMLPRLNL